jgi:mono/diheme cytochrome c family protein
MLGIVRRAGLTVAVALASLVSGQPTLLGQSAAPASAAPAAAPTFSKEVLPILQRSCQKCHRPGSMAPMSLLTYEDVRPWVRSIRTRVSTRQMPPWHLDRSIGEYMDDPSLSDAEIATVVKWIDAGAPRGNPADAPPPLTFTPLDEWVYGEPDLVVRMDKGFTIPASGPDFTPSEYVDPKVAEDRYIKWIQIIPEAQCCVHHSHVYASVPEGHDREGLGLGMGSNRDNEIDLIEYAAGNDADFYPDGMGKLVPAGSVFRFEPHYHPYGEEVRDRQRVGIKFYPKGYKPEYVVTSHRIRTDVGNQWTLNREKVEDVILRAGHKIDINETRMPTGALVEENPLHAATMLSIPPNTVARHDRYWPLPQNALVISFQPHMHFLGTRMLLEAIHPDGRREVLTDVIHYEQNWQVTYTYKTPHLFPKGTILHTVSWHDNTANNKHNPDPTTWRGWGSRTMDEMGHGWTDIAFLTDEQYQRELAKRRAGATAGKTQQND